MIHVHDLESAFIGALVAQIATPDAHYALEDFDPGMLSGYVPRYAAQTLASLVLDRGFGMTPPDARRALCAGLEGQEEAIEWILGLDPVAGEASDLDKLARQIISQRTAQDAEALLAACRVDPDSLDEDLGGIMSKLSELLSRVSDDRWKVETLSGYLRQYERGEAVIPPDQADSILVFGVPELDDPETGIIASRGTMGVIAAPPTWGKSVAVSQLAGQTALAGKHVLVTSLEQGRTQVAMRSIASLVQDFKGRVKRGGESRFVAQAYHDAAERISMLCPGSGTPWFRIEAAARRLHRRGKLDVLIVDYFTLLEPPSMGKQTTSAAAYGWISKAGKRLAQELGISVVFVAQFNRQMRTIDQEPEPSDLKETGQLEQDADWMLFLWATPKKEALKPLLHEENRVSCYKKAKNRWGKVDFSGDGHYLEIDPARDMIFSYTRTTDGCAAEGESYGRF